MPLLLGSYELHSGQGCSAGVRLLVQEDIADRFVDAVVEGARRIRLGGPFDEDARTGPLISAQHRENAEAYVAGGLAEGATVPPEPTGSATTSTGFDDEALAGLGWKAGTQAHPRRLPHLRSRNQLHLHPHRHLPALLLRHKQRRPRLLVVLANRFVGQLMVALCFCELAARYPVAGSVYNWSKRLGARTSAGWPDG